MLNALIKQLLGLLSSWGLLSDKRLPRLLCSKGERFRKQVIMNRSRPFLSPLSPLPLLPPAAIPNAVTPNLVVSRRFAIAEASSLC